MGTEIQRKLASIQRIEEIKPIENADAIEAYRVLGWKVVDKKGAHQVGDLVVYVSIDSWIPHELAPFLSKGREPREYCGVMGERLRTVKLRGQLSQGLLLPITSVCEWDEDNELWEYIDHPEIASEMGEVIEHADRIEIPISFTRVFADEGDDVTEILNIQKWEAPIPVQMQGVMRGEFPTSLIPKTDQERVQNCFDEMYARDDEYEVTVKIDGSSMTVFMLDGEVRVCSRNIEFKVDETNASNTFVRVALSIKDKLKEGYAYQGELYGENIQGNKEKIKGQKFAIFDIFDIVEHRYLSSSERLNMCGELGLEHAPVLVERAKMLDSVDLMLEMAEGPSINAKQREGVVWKSHTDPAVSFKVISNSWLLRHNE